MGNDTFYMTVETMMRIVLPPSYALVIYIVYRWLMPSMSGAPKRMAQLLLALQLLAVAMSLFVEPNSSFALWLWDVHEEWNFPSTLSSIMLAMVGGLALVGAIAFRPGLKILRAYLFGVFLVFAFLALDEYFVLHEFRISWDVHKTLGMAVVAGTLIVAALSPRRTWKFHACLLAGLAVAALGEIHVEFYGTLCGDYGWINVGECPHPNMWRLEEYLSLTGMWLMTVGMLGLYSEYSSAIPRLQPAPYLLPLLWLLLILPFAPSKSSAKQVGGLPADVTFESGAGLHAFRITNRADSVTVRVWLSPAGWDYHGLGYSISLVDQASGEPLVSNNSFANRHLEFHFAPGFIPVYRQWTRIDYSPEIPTNHAIWVVLTLWREEGDEYRSQKIVRSNLELLNDRQVVLGEFTRRNASTGAARQALAAFENGILLTGADFPDEAIVGETLPMRFDWYNERSGQEDLIQFLHFGHEASGEWWVYDQLPLGQRLPTRLWYRGLAEGALLQAPLPSDLAPGRYVVFTGLYRARDKERIPVTDADGQAWRDARVLLGSVSLATR